KKVDRMKSEFISTVSHELRTPVTSIKGALGLIAGGAVGELPEKADELVEIAKNNADRLVRLINDILDIEKLEFGRIEFNFEEADVCTLLSQAISQNQGYANSFNVNLSLVFNLAKDQSVYVKVDVYRFSQVMSNLISNAVKYSNSNETVEIQVDQQGDRVKVQVIDHGAGIPLEFQSRIFQKFAQADATDKRNPGGTGLGLSIVKTIVEKMQGDIAFISEPNRGSTFYFTLPVCKSS
ncbi:MAG: HAMP domain-containing sensor histidine kinase, partial [Gammaproteobacteria bacterium]|nr:HAMP domain-containing sensor histidine kinase [Gammaproteobacteria bacterium]